eukprot:SAG31_NODE_11482_length_1025_cov_1.901728_1_plen_253_part_10
MSGDHPAYMEQQQQMMLFYCAQQGYIWNGSGWIYSPAISTPRRSAVSEVMMQQQCAAWAMQHPQDAAQQQAPQIEQQQQQAAAAAVMPGRARAGRERKKKAASRAMVPCSHCLAEKSRSQYSPSQLRKKEQRRCRQCVDNRAPPPSAAAGRVAQPRPAEHAGSAASPGELVWWAANGVVSSASAGGGHCPTAPSSKATQTAWEPRRVALGGASVPHATALRRLALAALLHDRLQPPTAPAGLFGVLWLAAPQL